MAYDDWDSRLDGVVSDGHASVLLHGACCVCGRIMYRTAVQLGEATEWRHSSSGRPLSWSPHKHSALPVRVRVHGHRWGEVSGTVSCVVEGCDAQTMLLVVDHSPRVPYVRVKPRAVTQRRAAARRAADTGPRKTAG